MYDEYARADRSRRTSMRSGARPCCARAWFIAWRSDASARVGRAGAAGAISRIAAIPATKPTRTLVANGTRGKIAGASDERNPPKGGRRSAGRLGEQDRCEDDRSARELRRSELLPEPEPRDHRGRDRFEHRRDRGARRRHEAQRGDQEPERDDRPE